MRKAALETILVVDDDPEVLQYIASTLKRNGYSAIPAHSGDEAVRVYRRRHHEIGLLITDVVMPNTNGPALAESLEREQPGLRVLFMSGYKADHFEQYRDMLEKHAILSKPFTPGELLQTVRLALDGPTSSAAAG